MVKMITHIRTHLFKSSIAKARVLSVLIAKIVFDCIFAFFVNEYT